METGSGAPRRRPVHALFRPGPCLGALRANSSGMPRQACRKAAGAALGVSTALLFPALPIRECSVVSHIPIGNACSVPHVVANSAIVSPCIRFDGCPHHFRGSFTYAGNARRSATKVGVRRPVGTYELSHATAASGRSSIWHDWHDGIGDQSSLALPPAAKRLRTPDIGRSDTSIRPDGLAPHAASRSGPSAATGCIVRHAANREPTVGECEDGPILGVRAAWSPIRHGRSRRHHAPWRRKRAPVAGPTRRCSGRDPSDV